MKTRKSYSRYARTRRATTLHTPDSLVNQPTPPQAEHAPIENQRGFLPLAVLTDYGHNENDSLFIEIGTDDGQHVCKVSSYVPSENDRVEQMANFIVTACNNHEALLGAIMQVCRVIGVNETHLRPEQHDALHALAKAHDKARAEGGK